MVAPTKEESRGLVKGLVEKYLRDKEKWRTRNESETRAQFLDPMLKALGWDFDSPDEVRMELKVLDEESKKKIDYVLLINGVEKLIVEAKAIKEDISKIQYSRQAIEYAYNLSCSWSVLTNFEGLKIFYVGEEGAIFRDIQLANMERFDENFENLWLISHESFLIGTIERKAEDEGRKRRTVS
ncbi:type I restriction endonuclease, partial [Nitrososphaera sp.]|uniref:type I restriction endonuclease n=1 Tax=Nitrososphaera sp. TaxID=1971748 RepID=UPI00317626C5